MMILAGCVAGMACAGSPVVLDWKVGADLDGYHRINELVIINQSADTIRGPWQLYYGSQGPVLISESPLVEARQICGTHHAIASKSDYASIAPGDSLRMAFKGTYIHNHSFFPENPYLISYSEDGRELPPLRVDLNFSKVNHQEMAKAIAGYPDGNKIYERNARLTPNASLSPYHIIPQMKSVEITDGKAPCVINGIVMIEAPEDLAKESQVLADLLCRQGVKVANENATPIKLAIDKSIQNGDEGYRMKVDANGVTISGASAAGVANGCSSLLAILAGQNFPLALPAADISDSPDFGYRGLHFDVARNFTEKENVKKILDLMTLYKMNVLHFHLVDDEGWRLAIDGIDELTEIGSRRTHSHENGMSLPPAYGSGMDGNTSGNGYYTREDFKDILRYANDRHIKVIPEIELPGHARASIMAMNHRYHRYKDSDLKKATEYLLADFDDASVYTSAQDYHDCVMNIAMPSAFTFVKDVMADIIEMYDEAGAPLDVIHVGGDEVADGAWEGSPIAQAYMKAKNMASTQDLRDEFLLKLHSWLAPQGITIAGWQDIVTCDGGTKVNTSLPVKDMISYSWNTQPYGDMDQMTYKMVNAGCPTVLCNVNNLYLDLAYSANVEDGGLHWGGYVDEFSTLATNPYDIYASMVTLDDPNSWNPDAGKGKEQIDPKMKGNVLGVQGQMWSETYRNFDDVTERLFPKVLGVAERGWNADPDWESYNDFLKTCSEYASRTSLNEFDRASGMGLNYHVAPPGLKIIDGKLHANSIYPNVIIRYTTDGTLPDLNSHTWTSPTVLDSNVYTVRARAFINDRPSVTTELFLK